MTASKKNGIRPKTKRKTPTPADTTEYDAAPLYKLIPTHNSWLEIHRKYQSTAGLPLYEMIDSACDEESARSIIANLERPVIDIHEDEIDDSHYAKDD